MRRSAPRHLGRVLLAGALCAIVACGSDETDEATSEGRSSTSTADETTTADDTASSGASSSSAPEAAPETVEVEAVDYRFEGLPEVIAPGTKLTLVNRSEKELHELVAIALPEGEQRSAEELVNLPEEEQQQLSSGPPAMVLVAPPGEAPVVNAVGDGTLSAPGRYLILCAIPTGADPEEYMEAAAQSRGGPVEVPGGPPHLVHGMYADLMVE